MAGNLQNSDVLECAGIDMDIEARFAKDGQPKNPLVRRNTFELEEKSMERKQLEELMNARLATIAWSKGIAHVSDDVSAFLESALQVRLKQVVEDTMLSARRREDFTKSAFEAYHVESAPRQRVRDLNLRKQAEPDARAEVKRLALLTVAHACENKRKAPDIPDDALAAREQDDERAKAMKANMAAYNALGITRMDDKWTQMDPRASHATSNGTHELADKRVTPSTSTRRRQFSLLKQDCDTTCMR